MFLLTLFVQGIDMAHRGLSHSLQFRLAILIYYLTNRRYVKWD